MIVGVLCWYHEMPEQLATCVSGFSRVCDQIVAVDGAYALYPQAKPRSHPVQASTILHAAESAGVGCIIHRPREVFYGNEVEKRNLALSLARPFKPDWVLVFDADFQVVECHPELVREELERTDAVVATYELRDEWGAQPFRGIYRWSPSLAYGPKHSDVTADYFWGQEVLRGETNETHALDLNTLTVHHLDDRSQERRTAATAFDRMRNLYGIESHVVA